MKPLYLVLLFIICVAPCSAQNRLALLLDMKEGDNYPTGMPHIKEWINAAIDKAFIYDLQFSKSPRNDAGFISFSIIGRTPTTLVLPSTDSIRIPFEQAGKVTMGTLSNNIIVNYKDRMKAYIPGYSPANLKFTQEEYFYDATTVSNFDDGDIVAHVLNRMIETKKDKSVFTTFTDIVNKKAKIKLQYSKEESVKALLATFKEKQVNVKEALFKAFFKDKDIKIFSKKLNALLNYKGLFRNNVISELDEMRVFETTINMHKGEDLVFPVSIMTDGAGDAPARFRFTEVIAKLDYKAKKLQLTFKGKVASPVILKNANKWAYNFSTRKDEIHSADGEKVDALKEIIFIIYEKKITGEAITDKEVKYIFMQNKIR